MTVSLLKTWVMDIISSNTLLTRPVARVNAVQEQLLVIGYWDTSV